MSWPVISTAIKFGGPQVATAIDNLEPNAWKSDAMKAAADAWHQIVKDKYILEGSPGLDHKQSQTAWCQGKAAFISCGSWLESEQKDVTPAGFNMAVAPTPSLGSGDKLPFEAIRGTAGEPFIVPAKAQERAPAAWSTCGPCCRKKGAQDFTGKVVQPDRGRRRQPTGVELPFGLTTVVKALKASGDNGFNWVYNNYYRKLERNLVDAACGEFFSGRIGPAEFLDQCQKGADAIAQDSSIKKYKRARDGWGGVPPPADTGSSHRETWQVPADRHLPGAAAAAVRRLRRVAVPQAFQISTTDWLGLSPTPTSSGWTTSSACWHDELRLERVAEQRDRCWCWCRC